MMRARLAAARVAIGIVTAAFVTATFVVATSALAQDAALDTRLKKLEEELRCLVCQNQTLADSTAPLAEDLRREVRELAVAGKDDSQIKQYLVARYGDFVLYNPPVKATTWLLWFGPFALLAGGSVAWLLILRRRRGAAFGGDGGASPPVLTPSDGVARARSLLDEEQQEK
jgi:cytochrome c-type biogenesis protein CcmH